MPKDGVIGSGERTGINRIMAQELAGLVDFTTEIILPDRNFYRFYKIASFLIFG